MLRDRKISIQEVLTTKSEPYDKKWTRLPLLNCFINTDALEMWKQKGISCVACGITGEYFWKERTAGEGSMYNNWHLNLYAINNRGLEVLMTKDHMTAKANGGADEVSNLQPMCQPHNQKKAHHEMEHLMERISKEELFDGDEEWELAVSGTLAGLKEHYKLNYTKQQFFHDVRSQLNQRKRVRVEDKHVMLFDVKLRGKNVLLLYNVQKKMPLLVRPYIQYEVLYSESPRWTTDEKFKDVKFAEIYNNLMAAVKLNADTAKAMKENPETRDETYKFIKSCKNSGAVHALVDYPSKGRHMHHYGIWENIRRRYEPKAHPSLESAPSNHEDTSL